MMTKRIGKLVFPFIWPFLIVVGGLLLALLVQLDVNSPARQLLAVGYLLFCPGMAWIPLLSIENRFMQITLAIALSIALTTLVGLLLLYTNTYSTLSALYTILLLNSVGIVVNWYVTRTSARTQPPRAADPAARTMRLAPADGQRRVRPATRPILLRYKSRQLSAQTPSQGKPTKSEEEHP